METAKKCPSQQRDGLLSRSSRERSGRFATQRYAQQDLSSSCDTLLSHPPHVFPAAILLQQGRESTDGRSPLKKQAAIDLDDEEEDVDVADPAAQAEASPTVDAAALDDDRKDLKASLKAAEGRAAAAEAKATAAEARAAVAQAEAAALRIRLDLAAKALGALQSALCDQAAE